MSARWHCVAGEEADAAAERAADHADGQAAEHADACDHDSAASDVLDHRASRQEAVEGAVAPAPEGCRICGALVVAHVADDAVHVLGTKLADERWKDLLEPKPTDLSLRRMRTWSRPPTR
jgi:hypothetical protein